MKRAEVEAGHPMIPVVRQCGLLDMSRSSFYYCPGGEDGYDLTLMRRAVGVIPSVQSYVRLTIRYLIEYAEDWVIERSYIREDKALGSLDRLHELMAQAAN